MFTYCINPFIIATSKCHPSRADSTQEERKKEKTIKISPTYLQGNACLSPHSQKPTSLSKTNLKKSMRISPIASIFASYAHAMLAQNLSSGMPSVLHSTICKTSFATSLPFLPGKFTLPPSSLFRKQRQSRSS